MPYLQDIVDIHHLLKDLPVSERKIQISLLDKLSLHTLFVGVTTVLPGDGTTQATCEVFVEEKPVQRLLHGIRGLLCIPGDRDGDSCNHPGLCTLMGQVV